MKSVDPAELPPDPAELSPDPTELSPDPAELSPDPGDDLSLDSGALPVWTGVLSTDSDGFDRPSVGSGALLLIAGASLFVAHET